jgi:sensor c-di-GMP phosphodiesterase-like protein
VRGLSRKNLVAIVLGVVLAGAPLIAFNFWLDGLIDRQGQAEVATAARRAVALANSRLKMVIEALDGLAVQAVNSCQPGHIAAMRQAAFSAMPIKEVAIVGPEGQTLCTHLGLPLGQRNLTASVPLVGADGYTIDIMQISNGQQMVRLRRKVVAGPNEIAALMPVLLLLPQVSIEGSPFSAYAHLATRDGTLIGVTGKRPKDSDARFFGKAKSEKFGFEAEIIAPRALLPTENFGLKWFSLFASGAIALTLVIFAIQMRRRASGNPIAEIERALEAGQFIPYYQPIVDIRSGQLRGAEVLVRWRKPDGSLVLPGAFIPLAESSGLILDLTLDLMRRVCVEAGAAIGARPGLKISFNFAAQLFRDESIVKDVRDIFANTPIDFSQVVLELTERDPIENFTETRRVIAALQGLGVRIAIDDVGTGHSGLSYMLKLGVDIIKIDKMFVDSIGVDRNSTTIVETLIDLAHNMRMDVVAEGVETFEQVVHLRELGIRSAQGYVFAPPLPGSSFLQLVEAIDPLTAASVEEKVAGAAQRFMTARSRFGAA